MRGGGHQCGLRGASGRGSPSVFLLNLLLLFLRMRGGGHQRGLRGASGRGNPAVSVKPALIGLAHAWWRSSMWIAKSSCVR
jgi:hypothetical protein